MILTLTSLDDLAAHAFDDIIDVRAPAEYAEDHLPGAISLPVLNDEERARVGTTYTRVDRFEARKIGAALVARNAATHLEGPLADKSGGWHPLVYCWRGGQRSGSFATILRQVGWRVTVLEGGYRSYRRLVAEAMHDAALPHLVILLDGNTGTAKTELLEGLRTRGHQVVDLERLAAHRGSVFGAMPGGQPSQKAFEGRLAMVLAGMDPGRPVVMEAESSKIGEVQIPPSLWSAMRAAPRIRLSAPVPERVAYLLRAYADLIADPAALMPVLAALRPIQGTEKVDHWQALAASGQFGALAEALVVEHYDPRYTKSRARGGPGVDVALDSLAEGAMDAALDRIEAALPEVAAVPR
ncbi:tRNA 2-selenouridine(34) synthase MnmH [Halovulum dunhuangense]|uniref:tRNA 2-selenouridine(34) synthase MnmH n=1 Tax=Halovulum dunhuangense TaxID=1505036 RepID=A0A849L3F4_9RHOB|nr:tRNA 2-selenouridine(34) synthase MnmH [Halovulum dunhuangense]NNU80845.1 tRNA 2-selenouridine(34) synthase MnmH [Halovulum dunhuangense]